MSDVAVIVLIGQEKIHLQRCVEKLAALSPRQIFLVESQPDDGGYERCRALDRRWRQFGKVN